MATHKRFGSLISLPNDAARGIGQAHFLALPSPKAMIRLLSPLLIPLFAGLAVCRFTVRDVAFVDLGDTPYQLVAFISASDQPEGAAQFSSLTAAILAEANVDARCIDPDEESEDSASQYLSQLQIQDYPAAVLIAPDGRARNVPLVRDEMSFDESAGICIEALVSSPRRTEIRDAVLAHLCVIVTAEGRDATANQAAHSAATEAIAEIEKVFDRMPKAVGDLPIEISIPFVERKREALLLWSLGIDEGEEPAAVVMFGRTRRVGPALRGTAIDGRSLFGILANTGQSCECGLDRSWMRGPRIPTRWDEDTRSRATKLLAFDPDSPMVKAEVSSILARGNEKKSTPGASVEELLLGYSEEAVFETPQQAGKEQAGKEQAGKEQPGKTRPQDTREFSDFDASDDNHSRWMSNTLFVISAIALISTLIGAIILLVRRRT